MTIKELKEHIEELINSGAITEDSVVDTSVYENTNPYDDGDWKLMNYKLTKEDILVKKGNLNISL